MGFLMALMFTLFAVCGVFLILIVLIQRGKGGGLAGAFGGMGGHSAFGTRAGDKLMRITIGVAATWIILAMVTVRLTGSSTSTTRFTGPSGAIVEPSSAQDESSGMPTLPGLDGEASEDPLLGPAEGEPETPEPGAENAPNDGAVQLPALPTEPEPSAPADPDEPPPAADTAPAPESDGT